MLFNKKNRPIIAIGIKSRVNNILNKKNLSHYLKHRQKHSRSQRGFSMIELLITAFLIGTVVTGLFGLFVLSIRANQEAERRVVAIALANERMEMARNLPYTEVGTAGGIPAGSIAQLETITRNSQPYEVRTDIRFVDDPFDGLLSDSPAGKVVVAHKPPGNPGGCQTLVVAITALTAHQNHGDSIGPCSGDPDPNGGDSINTDYKQVRVSVSWPSHYSIRPVTLITFIVPKGIEGGEIGGTLDFQALDSNGQPVAGATVNLVNAFTSPQVNITTQTDANGRVVLPGLPEDADRYEISVSKAGYNTEQTYSTTATFIPDADHSHLSMIVYQVTKKTFFIDRVAQVAIKTREANLASLNFDATDTDYVEISHNAAYASADGTITFWFRADDVSAAGQGLFSKDSSDFDAGGHLSLFLEGSTLKAKLESSSAENFVEVTGINVGTWYHVAMTFGSGGIKLYVNGENPVINGYVGGTSSNSEPIVIGAGSWNSADGSAIPVSDPYDGLIDDIRVYNRTLNQAEVQDIANTGAGSTSGLVGYWRLDTITGTNLPDDSGNGNDGQAQNSPSLNANVPVGASAIVVSNLNYTFNGTKTIGQDNLGQPVYVFDVTDQTDSAGEDSYNNLVWDSYSFNINGPTTGFDIKDSNPPLPLTVNPADSINLVLGLSPYSAISLRVTVTDGGGAPLRDATVHLSDNGVNEIISSSASGQVFFPGLPVNNDYTVEIDASGFAPYNQPISVNGTTTATIPLTPL